MKKKVGIVSLGCPKNLVDSEIMLGILDKEGYEITNDKTSAEIIIVNTCGFIESAKTESIESILEMSECKKGKCKLLIVTGCLAERYREQILEQIPEVDAVVGTGNYKDIAKIIMDSQNNERKTYCELKESIDYLNENRVLTSNKGYAYIKIAEGCNNRCNYCVIPLLRGNYRSRNMEDIIKEAEGLSAKGIKEIILIAQDTTNYGSDIYGERKLAELVNRVSEIEDIEWIRLLYCYPDRLDTKLLEVIAQNNKVCKYIDIPVQHASDKILGKMGRRGTGAGIKKAIDTLRNKIPGIVIRTSLIVGFPGEDEQDFEMLCKFVEEIKFDRLGVFTYSKEEGTPAAKFKSQVIKKIKQDRYNRVMEIQSAVVRGKNAKKLGRIYKTLVEGISDDGIFYYGRTFAEAPEIDGYIYFTSVEPLKSGQFVNVRILNTNDFDLTGEVANESSK